MKKFGWILAAFALTGCGIFHGKTEEKTVQIDGLTKAANDIRDEIRKLSISNPLPSRDTPVGGCTSRTGSIDNFHGDVMLFIEELRQSHVCDIRITGKKPRPQLVLALDYRNVPLWQILEDAGTQLGAMAQIQISRTAIVFAFAPEPTPSVGEQRPGIGK